MGLVLALIQIASGYLQSMHNGEIQTVGKDIEVADKALTAVLQENARIKGVTINWQDPAAVSTFIQTIPTFTPIPEPGAPSAGPGSGS